MRSAVAHKIGTRPERQTLLPHQARDAAAPAMMPELPQPAHHPGTAVFAAACRVRLLNEWPQRRVGLRPWPGPPRRPGVITAACDRQGLAQVGDGIFRRHGFYPREPLPGTSEIIPKVFLECLVARSRGAARVANDGSRLGALRAC